MSTRSYESPARAAAAAEKRGRIVEMTIELMRSEKDVTAISLDAVAKKAGVTRLTVYNQFGSRRGLLEAVLDRLAHDAGFDTIASIMALGDPREALEQLVDLMCRAWSFDASMARLHAAAHIDPEFAELVERRVERRRAVLNTLVKRMPDSSRLTDAQRQELVDLLFVATSYPAYELLSAKRRSPERVAGLIKRMCTALLDDALNPRQRRPSR
jgi:AcrR family transcriptional regulator